MERIFKWLFGEDINLLKIFFLLIKHRKKKLKNCYAGRLLCWQEWSF